MTTTPHDPTTEPFAHAAWAADQLRADLDLDSVDIAVVCGSGLGAWADQLATNGATVPMDSTYGFAEPGVAGHAGQIVTGTVGRHTVLAYAGRTHLYEGHHVHRTVHNVRVAAALGAHTVILTNAAGGISGTVDVGELVAIVDHINLTGANPLEGPLDDPRSRFVDMSCAYDRRILNTAEQVMWERRSTQGHTGVAERSLRSGVYAAFRGPSYETPAEIRMASTFGADLAGMSTVCETIAARHCELDVAAFSLVTNLAAGRGGTLSHSEVADVANAAAADTCGFLTDLIAAL